MHLKSATSDDISHNSSSSVASHLAWESCVCYLCVCLQYCSTHTSMSSASEIDVAQGLGLCIQRFNDRTPEGWHISQVEHTNTLLHKPFVDFTTSILTFLWFNTGNTAKSWERQVWPCFVALGALCHTLAKVWSACAGTGRNAAGAEESCVFEAK